MVNEVRSLDSGLDPFLLAKNILKMDSILCRAKKRNILENQFFLTLLQDICIASHIVPPLRCDLFELE
jgi:hypothetical protein